MSSIDAQEFSPADFSQIKSEKPKVDLKLDSLTPLATGGELAKAVCQACHLYPDPSLMDKRTWRTGALPLMSHWLGLRPKTLDDWPGGERVRAAGVFPESPLLTEQQWNSIKAFYLAEAPEKPLPQNRRVPIETGLNLFQVETPKARFETPMTSFLHIDAPRRRVLQSDAGTRTLNAFSSNGDLLESISLPSPAAALSRHGDRFILSLIGSVFPSDEWNGAVREISLTGKLSAGKPLLNSLPRLTHSQSADLNGDGIPDIVTCGFGNFLGELAWWEGNREGSFTKHVLVETPGSVSVRIHDVNEDGRLDLVVLMAQAREGVLAFLNQGSGRFDEKTLLEHHPAFGSTSLEMVDFNGDGRLDLLTTNGDNGEYESCAKNYHGIRVYISESPIEYAERCFFPLNGAFKAIARDFDQDGDLDIAAISFFPDYALSPEESFVYLENTGDMRFRALTFKQAIAGRWITMAAGDLDGDGDEDLVLGSFVEGPNRIPTVYRNLWKKSGPSFLLLRNKTIDK